MRVMVFVPGDKRSEAGEMPTEELIAKMMKFNEEAVDWLKRAPFDGGVEIAIRPIFDPEDFGKELTPELAARDVPRHVYFCPAGSFEVQSATHILSP